jgi:RNA 2',3'-cyclic 3'-phosphodiesterase
MALMRLFTGLDLPDEVVRNLEALLKRLRPSARIHWSPPANLHVTTKFIGEWPAERLTELREALEKMPPRPPIEVAIARVGFFPNARAPRVFWCGIEAPGLEALAADTDGATATLGVAREQRAFSPHLTLARITQARNREPVDLKSLQRAIGVLPSVDFGSFAAQSFFLYQSQLRPSGSVYTKLSEYPFVQR